MTPLFAQIASLRNFRRPYYTEDIINHYQSNKILLVDRQDHFILVITMRGLLKITSNIENI